MEDQNTPTIFETVAVAVVMVLIAILSVVYKKAEKQDLWLLWLDAYLYSDCNAPEGSYAIRKNNGTCYQFIWKSYFQLELREYPAPKP